MMRKLVVAALAVVAMSSGIWVQNNLGAAQKSEGDPVTVDLSPAFPDLEGKKHRMDEWKGKILVINFWATWCAPCLEEMPEFVKLQSELGGQGLQFVGVAIDDAESVKGFLSKTPVNYPILIGEDGADSWAFSLGNRVNALPFTAVVSRSGHLLHVEQGPFKRDEVMKVITGELSSSKPSPSGVKQ